MVAQLDNSAHWVYEMYRDADSMDVERAASWLTDDVVQQFGNMPPTRGIEAAKAGLQMAFTRFKAMRHEFVGVWDTNDATIAEASITYTLPDDHQVVIPATTIIRRRGDKACEMRIYIDMSALGPPH